MTLEDQIAALIEEAAPLRLLPDDQAEAQGLSGIVDKINALRAEQAAGLVRQMADADAMLSNNVVWPLALDADAGSEPKIEYEGADQVAALPKRRPGRPRKVA